MTRLSSTSQRSHVGFGEANRCRNQPCHTLTIHRRSLGRQRGWLMSRPTWNRGRSRRRRAGRLERPDGVTAKSRRRELAVRAPPPGGVDQRGAIIVRVNRVRTEARFRGPTPRRPARRRLDCTRAGPVQPRLRIWSVHRSIRGSLIVVALSLLGSSASVRTAPAGTAHAQGAAAPITYRITFPEPEHHWMQVEMTVKGLGPQPLQARMSRSSPGRYAVHEFAKNVFSLEAFNGKGTKLAFTRPNVDEWDVAGHDGTVRVVYKIFGDHADGTYMGVDTTHAHLNMPAAVMWAVGHDLDPVQFTFVPPAGLNWKIATQLFPTSDPWTFTSPNLQYYMDSPTELSDFLMSRFSVPNTDGSTANFRVMIHGGDTTQADLDAFTPMIQRLVREEM